MHLKRERGGREGGKERGTEREREKIESGERKREGLCKSVCLYVYVCMWLMSAESSSAGLAAGGLTVSSTFIGVYECV